MRLINSILIQLILFFAIVPLSHGESLYLEWNPNGESDLAGYNVYYGTSSGSYGNPIDVGNVTTYELTGLDAGVRYYVAITAHDTADNESEKSDEENGVPADTENPTITITMPTASSTYSTETASISIAGSASDNVGVTGVSWVNDRGGAGSASGTSSWSVSNISLAYGENLITVTARDNAGNTESDSITILYTLPSGSYTEEFGDAESSDHSGSVEDTFINKNHDKNYNSTQLITYTYPTNVVANAIILKWNLSALPTDAYIQNATLSLYQTGSGGDDLYTLSAHKIINHNPLITECDGYTYDGLNSWTESGQNPPLAQADIQPAVDSKDIDTDTGYKSWNVTPIVRDWIANSTTNYGMLINADSTAAADSRRYFASTEDEMSSRRPKLVVTFFVGDDTSNPTVTITEPTSTASYTTNQQTIDLGGTASDNLEVTQITWSNNRGGAGTASGTIAWSVTGINLQSGNNTITVTASDAAGNTGTDSIDIQYTAPTTSTTSSIISTTTTTVVSTSTTIPTTTTSVATSTTTVPTTTTSVASTTTTVTPTTSTTTPATTTAPATTTSIAVPTTIPVTTTTVPSGNNTLSGRIMINNDEEVTTSREVILSLYAAYVEVPQLASALFAGEELGPDAVMCISNDGKQWSPFEPYSQTKQWTLEPGNGLKTVYAGFRDGEGNWISEPVEDQIILEEAQPTCADDPQKLQPLSVTASSNSPRYSADNLIDGDPSTIWSSVVSLFQKDQYITLDLGTTKKVIELSMYASRLFGVDFFPTNFKIQVSHDNTTWLDISTVEGFVFGQSLTSGSWNTNGLECRYIRIYITRSKALFLLFKLAQIAEIEVYGCDASGELPLLAGESSYAQSNKQQTATEQRESSRVTENQNTTPGTPSKPTVTFLE